jgi:stringent starvation protein B
LRALYEWIVDSGEIPNVLIDAEIDGVVVPEEHVRDGQIVLNISPQAVRNLNLGDDFVMCEGTFLRAFDGADIANYQHPRDLLQRLRAGLGF